MLLTTHVSTTLLICQGLNNPWLAFFIGLTTHYLMDILPHGDRIKEKKYLLNDVKYYRQNKKEFRRFKFIAPIDVAAACLLAGFLYLSDYILYPGIIIPGIIGAVLPDAFNGLSLITENKIILKINKLHLWVHSFISDIPWRSALAGQIIYNILVLYILYFSKYGVVV